MAVDLSDKGGAPKWLWSNVSLNGVPLSLPKSAEHLVIPKTGVLKVTLPYRAYRLESAVSTYLPSAPGLPIRAFGSPRNDLPALRCPTGHVCSSLSTSSRLGHLCRSSANTSTSC